LGDWTKDLFEKIEDNTNIIVEGPYGEFNSKKKKNNLEIWIAGGIGITPFISMLQDYKIKNNLNKNIIFVWSVKDKSEAIYKEEIEKNLPENIKFILHDTSQFGFFRFDSLLSQIRDRKKTSIYICGPIQMREAIINDAKKENFSDFHFEEFNFR
jgi:predicted ferric reductase